MASFLLISTVYLATMIAAVPVATRLGLGSVLGYLVAGILIGPVLGLTGSEGQMADLQHFAEFGVVMMLFLIGLELEPRTLWEMRRRLLGLGGAQICLTMGLLTALGLLLNQDFSTALALGMILSLSSTAIVLQTLSEKSLMQTGGGRAAFSVLLMQDIAVIPMIALMPLLAGSGGGAALDSDAVHGALLTDLPGWAATLVTLGAVGFVVLAGPRLFRPLFRFVIATRLNEMSTALALLVVVAIASLMNLVGLSPALGTFLAGVMLAGSEFRHELEAQINPFKGLLLGLFFITVGAGMNFDMLAERPVTVIGVTASIIAIKAAVLFFVARVSRMRRQDRSLFTLSLAQAGEFGFVLISYAVSLRIFDEKMAEGFLLVVALSMLATPALFLLNERITRWLGEEGSGPEPERIEQTEMIVIAGIGRFGQVVNRLVTMSGFRTTVLDSDLATIQLMRRYGFKGYFGDPTNPEILAAAGIDRATILVAALDDPAQNLKLVRFARERRPDLKIIARARDRISVYELYEAKADHIVREMFDSSLRAGRYVLENAGLSEYEAAELERIYYQYDRGGLRQQAELWRPGVPSEQNAEYMALTRQQNQALETALMERFAAGPAAAPISDSGDEAEHGLHVPPGSPHRLRPARARASVDDEDGPAPQRQ